MKTACNPGRWLLVEGSFELRRYDAGLRAMVIDRESDRTVSLDELLRSFLEDPSDRVTGPIRITIEAAGP